MFGISYNCFYRFDYNLNMSNVTQIIGVKFDEKFWQRSQTYE